MHHHSFLFLCITFFLFQSCTSEKGNTTTEAATPGEPLTYYDLEGLIKEQVAALSKEQPKVEKIFMRGDRKEQLQTKNINWEEELKVFQEADLNKPMLLGSYDSSQRKDGSQLITIYRAKDVGEHIQQFEVKEFDGQPEAIHIQMQETNMLFKIKRTLLLEFDNGLLASYSLEESQKLLFRSSFDYRVEAKVKI